MEIAVWLQRDGAGMTLRYGHRGGELLAIEEPQSRERGRARLWVVQ